MDSFDVAIVGMGPVGATAAILFAHAGLNVAVIERDKDVYPLPRAVAMDGEIVRAFQRVGIAEDVTALLQTTRPGDRAGFANSRREWLFGQDWQSFGPNGWQPISMFDQPEMDGFLRATAASQPNVTTFIGEEMVGFVDRGDTVLLEVKNLDDDTIRRLESTYVLACDGAASGVRQTLGVGWRDLGYDHDWLVVDVITRPGHTLTLDTVQVCDPDRLATYVATKDPYRRWEFKLNPGESRQEMLEPAKIHELIDPWTPRGTYELRRAAVYQFHAATADRWRVGRVLLAGDAAHQTPPFLGQGMNAGMRDVINLAWKFPLVVSGQADKSLLDSYEDERSAHAADLVDWAVAIGQLMEHLAAVEAAQRDGSPRPAEPVGRQFAGYGQGRENPPLRGGVVMLDQVSDSGSTGYLFSQPIVSDAGQRQFGFDERLGAGFAIVARTAADLRLNEASRRLVETLGIATTTLEGVTEARGHFDRLFEHAAAAVVRPDRYVFGHTSETLDLDGLLMALEGKLTLNTSRVQKM